VGAPRREEEEGGVVGRPVGRAAGGGTRRQFDAVMQSGGRGGMGL
jgi:hypothetical protein